MALAVDVEPVAAKELEWRRARSSAAKAASSKRSRALPSERSPEAKTARSDSKFQRPLRDSAVRPAAFEEEGSGLQLSDAAAGQTSLKSVVVNGDSEASGEFRAAQLPMELEPSAGTPPNGGSRYEEELRTPFGADQPQGTTPQDTTEADSLFDEPTREIEVDEELDVESMQLPENGAEQLRTNGQERSPADRPPSTFQLPRTFQQPPDDDRLPVGPDGRPLPTEPTTSDELAEEREQRMEICSEELQELKSSTLHDVDLRIGIAGTEGQDYPFECTIDDGTWHAGRTWDQTTYMWKASALCHKPLYFENESLERYGHSWGPCLDPLVSGAHFFTRLPVLPYCMGVEPPHECVYALGHYRPGSCAPYLIYPVPLSARGAAFQAGAVVGAAAILP